MSTVQTPYGEAEKRIGAYMAPLKVSAQDTPTMTVKVSAGSYFNSVNDFISFAGGNSSVITTPTSNSKWVLITLGNSGTIQVVDPIGHAAGSVSPSFPAIPTGALLLGAVYVTSLTTAITSSLISDIRPVVRSMDVVPDLTTAVAALPTMSDVTGLLVSKADLGGSTSASFALNQGSVLNQPFAYFTATRPTGLDVSIRWNEVGGVWEFTNDGTIWSTIASSSTFAGTFSGDVTGGQSTTVVATVGTSSAANIHAAELAANAATNANTVSTIVKRDASGNFTAGTITAALAGNATTAGTAGTVTTAAQPTITSVGTLTGLTVTAPISGSVLGNAGTATVAVTAGIATVADNLEGGTLGQIPYQSGVSTTLFAPANTSATPSFVASIGTGSAAQAPSLVSSTGTGSVVLATSPTLVTPVLGTPTSGNFGTGTFTWPTFNQSTSGNADTATTAGSVTNATLTTALTVNTGTLTLTAAAANTSVLTIGAGAVSVSGTNTGDSAANSSTMYIGSTAVTLDRTSAALVLTGITSIDGTAAGLSSTLIATSGGTGQSTYAVGDLLVGGATNTLDKLADVAVGSLLVSGGVGVTPSWSSTPALGTPTSGNFSTGTFTWPSSLAPVASPVFTGVPVLPIHTIGSGAGQLPAASSCPGGVAIVSDSANPAPGTYAMCISNGTNWIDVKTGMNLS